MKLGVRSRKQLAQALDRETGRGGLTPARVTLATVAEALGVSTMTVSNAYNRPEKLSAELRERILAKADELGYAGPNVLARSLRRGRTGVLGVVLGEALTYAFEDPATVEFFRGLAVGRDRAAARARDRRRGRRGAGARRRGRRLRPLRAAGRAPAGRGRAAPAAARWSCRAGRGWRVTRSWRSTSARRRPRPRTHLRALGHTRLAVLIAAVLADAIAPTARCGPSAPAHRVTRGRLRGLRRRRWARGGVQRPRARRGGRGGCCSTAPSRPPACCA